MKFFKCRKSFWMDGVNTMIPLGQMFATSEPWALPMPKQDDSDRYARADLDIPPLKIEDFWEEITSEIL